MSNKGPKSFSVIRPGTNPQAGLRLFCFPYAGGGASIYRHWRESLPADLDLIAVQLPGRETRLQEAPFTRLSPLARALAPALLPLLDRPFAFFGHSLGALVSFEMAREIRREYGLSPVHLFVSGRGAPQVQKERSPVHALPEEELIEKLRRLNGTPQAVLEHPELLKLVLPILRADFAVCETYVYYDDEPLSCPITAYGGLQDKDVSRDCLGAWRDQTSASFSLSMFPGDHFFLHSSLPLLLRRLSQELSRLIDEVTGGDRTKYLTGVLASQAAESTQSLP